MSTTIDLEHLPIGQHVTMRYPSGILQEATLVGNDDGILNFHFGDFVHDAVGPVIDIFLNRHGDWSFGPRAIDRFH